VFKIANISLFNFYTLPRFKSYLIVTLLYLLITLKYQGLGFRFFLPRKNCDHLLLPSVSMSLLRVVTPFTQSKHLMEYKAQGILYESNVIAYVAIEIVASVH
jgi:hypothetical protein